MKKPLLIIVSILMTCSLAACVGNNNNSSESISSTTVADSTNEGSQTQNTPSTNATDSSAAAPAESQSENTTKETKILVAYFSATGTTKAIAQYAANATGADLYEITPADPYTAADLDYGDKSSRSTKEMDDENCRPEISGSVENMADYDIVLIGYPIWWGEAPRIVSTFVESYDFSGKTVVTFSTSGGSSHNDSSIKSLVNGSNWITGTRISSSASQSDVADWIGGLGLDITLN